MLVATLAAHTSTTAALPTSLPLAALVIAALATAFAQRRRSFLATFAFAAGTQLLLHVILVIGDLSHAHGSLLPGQLMLTGHVIAALVVAAVAWEADHIVLALQRMLTAWAPRFPRLPTMQRAVAFAPATPMLAPAHPRAWSTRGPPSCS